MGQTWANSSMLESLADGKSTPREGKSIQSGQSLVDV